MGKLSYGIDFGTTNSTVAVVDKSGRVQKLSIDPKAPNDTVMRSITYISPEGKFLYGQAAVTAYLIDVAQGKGRTLKTVYTGNMIKLSREADIHGAREDEWVEEILEIDEFSGGRLLQALKSVLTRPDITSINLFGKKYSLEQVVAGILAEMKQRADRIVGQDVTSTVIGRPVKYVGGDDKLAVSRMRTAALLAGFKQISFEFEPIGAAYDYGSNLSRAETILVFDFGGGTLDVSVVRFPEGKVLANVGNPIGGDYFDSKIFDQKIAKYFGKDARYGLKQLPLPHYIFAHLQSWYEATLLKSESFPETIKDFKFLSSDEDAIERLRSLVMNNLSFSMYEEIDRVKKEISKKDKEEFSFFAESIDIKEMITRLEFEEILGEDILSIKDTLRDALIQSGVNQDKIDAVVTTGGSSLIPIVRACLEETFGKDKIVEQDVFTSVASGLAIRANEQS